MCPLLALDDLASVPTGIAFQGMLKLSVGGAVQWNALATLDKSSPRRRSAAQAGLDSAAWVVALLVAVDGRRLGPELESLPWPGQVVFPAVAVAAQCIAGVVHRLYLGRYRYGSFDEVLGVLKTALAVTGSLVLVSLASAPAFLWADRISYMLETSMVALLILLGSRYSWRIILERLHRPQGDDLERVIVFGAGEAGTQIVTAMMADSQGRYVPVALLDDDRRKRHLQIRGVKVVGNRTALASVAVQFNAQSLIIAAPSASAAVLREVSALAANAGLPVKTLPSVDDLLGVPVEVENIRELEPADLLGRRPRETDIETAGGYLTSKTVLVTGAGGSIGAELCRVINRFEPGRLVMLDHDESGLHAVQLSLEGRALLDSSDIVLADIRDEHRLQSLFEEHRPQIVFHAAALKHLPLLERYPAESVKTNIWGTQAVLQAAVAVGVECFVNVSTDKAADPSSVLGYSKRISERLTAFAGQGKSGVYLSTRFGNVIDSRGSVLQTFTSQLAAGGPLTVTDPHATRYFMTIQEAVELVIHAGGIGQSGEVLILDMGEPVRIGDVAKRLAASRGEPVGIVYTGLRPGEKLHETLWEEGEQDERPKHPLISHSAVPPLSPILARSLDLTLDRGELVAQLRALVGMRRRRINDRRTALPHGAYTGPERRDRERRREGHLPRTLESYNGRSS